MKNERELYVLELGGFGVIDAVFNDIDECIYFSCFDFCGLTKDDITFGYRIWQASANREGYKLVPVEASELMLNAGLNCEHEIDNFVVIDEIYKAMIGACDDH